MLYNLLSILFVVCAVLLVLLVLLQRGKSSMGIGAIGGGQQQLFGGSGGQDLFQKITWVLGAALIIGSGALAYYKTRQTSGTTFAPMSQNAPMESTPIDDQF